KDANAGRRQTARLEGRRDGKPLVFGWGSHLTRRQKTQIQERSAYTFIGLIGLAVVGVFIFVVIQQNVLIPNQSIVRVNTVDISQDAYRKQLAFNAQTAWNNLQSELKQFNALSGQTDPASTTKHQTLQAEIQADEGNFGQSTITQTTIDQL